MLEIGAHIGWNHGESQVYAAKWYGQPAILKRHREKRKHVREQHGYATWAKTGLLPRLLHADPERLELVLERIPAASALEQPQTAAIYRAAGAALRQLHDAAPRTIPFDDGRSDIHNLASRYFSRAETVLPEAQIREVQRQVDALLSAPLPSTVLRHADYTARNWLWDGQHLTVIDTEMARPGPAVLDVVKMTNDLFHLDNGAALLAAFQSGYGREWTPQEAHFLNAVRAFDALLLAVWCHNHNDENGFHKSSAVLSALL